MLSRTSRRTVALVALTGCLSLSVPAAQAAQGKDRPARARAEQRAPELNPLAAAWTFLTSLWQGGTSLPPGQHPPGTSGNGPGQGTPEGSGLDPHGGGK